MECKIKMTDKVRPVEGTVKAASSGGGTGTCPECLTPGVLLSIVGGYIRKHTIAPVEIPENNPQAPTLVDKPSKKAGKFLSEPQLDVAATGSQVGDPRAAAQRRTADIGGAYAQGTVKVPVKGDKGRDKLTDVPATEANVRKALNYWLKRKPRSDASRKAQNENVSLLTRRLEAMRKGTIALTAVESPEGRTAHVLSGPAIVQGPNMAPVQRTWRNPATGEKEIAASRLDGALTERLDRTVADKPEVAHRSASQRANYRKKMRRQAMKSLVERQGGQA